jgi:hypothetical protein
MFKMGSHDPFGHLQHKLWPKERSGVKLAVWLSTMRSRESNHFPCVQVACDMPLESSRQGLQLRFRPRPDRRFTQEVIVPQSCEIPSLGDFGTPGTKSHLDATCRVVQNILYWGRWWLPPESELWWVLWIRGRPWFVLAPRVLQPCANQLVCWFCAGLLEWVNCLSLFLVPSRSSSTPLYHSKVLRAGSVPRNPNLFRCFHT